MRNLIIVESPNKTKKIEGFLGAGWKAIATVGHFRDLPNKEIGIKVENNVRMNYVIHNSRVFSNLKENCSNADQIYICTDPDREGEAIAWHVIDALHLKANKYKRAVFNSITESAVKKAIQEARDVDYALVNAQQARRAIDRLFGFLVSQKLWSINLKRAGRVQSSALWILVDRERKIRNFKPRDFWTVKAHYNKDGKSFTGELVNKNGDKWTKAEFNNSANAEEITKTAKGGHTIIQIETKRVKKKPLPPFTTSTLQQYAGSALKIAPGETMKLAQKLFESGFITYHRTDAVFLSPEAQQMAKDILKKTSPKIIPDTPPVYKSKSGAQEAHEAIRPTHEDDSSKIQGQELALYKLIRSRFLASQCVPSEYDNTTVILKKDQYRFRAKGSQLVKLGFEILWVHEEDIDDKENEQKLPTMLENNIMNCQKIDAMKSTTKPPSRYSEPQFIKKLEKEGIGRPATYANTIETLKKEYVSIQKRKMIPTHDGERCTEALEKAFAVYIRTDYTKEMEKQLDEIAESKIQWEEFIKKFYTNLQPVLGNASSLLQEFSTPESAKEIYDKPCPECGSKMIIRKSKKGTKFAGCSKYPECKGVIWLNEVKISRNKCPECGGSLAEMKGKFGKYFKCQSCGGNISEAKIKAHKSQAKTTKLGLKCPKCGASVIEKSYKDKTTKKMKKFFGCTKFPECKGAIWQ